MIRGQFLRRGHVRLLGIESIRQRLQTALLGHRSTGTTLRTVGTVKILQVGHGHRPIQRRRQFLSEGALLLDDSAVFFPLFLQVTQIHQPFSQFPQHLVVQRAGLLFTIAGDKGDGVTVIQ